VTWQDVDWKGERIHFVRRKTGKAFYVPLFPWLNPFISDLWQRSGKPATGRIFNIRSAKQAIRNACKRLDLTFFSPRDFRKMGIVRQIRAGLDERMVAKFQGHSDNGQLIYSTYTSEFDSDERERERKIIEGLKE
jgi:integrase